MPPTVPQELRVIPDSLADIPVEFVLTDSLNTRVVETDEELLALGTSMKEQGQQQAITVRRNKVEGTAPQTFTVNKGHRRLMAAKLVGLQTIRAIIEETQRSDKDILLDRLAENKARKDLTPLEHVDAICRALADHPGATGKALADKTGYTESEISKAKGIKECPVAYPALADGRLKALKPAYTVAKAAPEQKSGVLNLLMNGATCEEAAKAARKPRQQGEKVTRLAISLPDGVNVTLAGKDMDLEQVIEHLSECLKAAKKARDERLSAKVFAQGMKDKHKGG